jgi:vacuolar-type H+-ATPase subunit H
MAERNFLSWVGFRGQVESAPSENAVERIRVLEAQLADLRARRDITSLSKDEFENLATDTSMSLIKAAQQRESRAIAAAERSIADAERIVQEKLSGSEAKAKSILSGAEARGRKYLAAAESEANELKNEVLHKAENLLNLSKREAAALGAAAKREAETITAKAKQEARAITANATADVGSYRSWLTSAISEAERLYRIQTQSLSSAERAISETKERLQTAFERLAKLQGDIDSNLDENNQPVMKSFATNTEAVIKPEVPQIRKVSKKTGKKPIKKNAKKVTSKKRK